MFQVLGVAVITHPYAIHHNAFVRKPKVGRSYAVDDVLVPTRTAMTSQPSPETNPTDLAPVGQEIPEVLKDWVASLRSDHDYAFKVSLIIASRVSAVSARLLYSAALSSHSCESSSEGIWSMATCIF